jgi:hypothetical protein
MQLQLALIGKCNSEARCIIPDKTNTLETQGGGAAALLGKEVFPCPY